MSTLLKPKLQYGATFQRRHSADIGLEIKFLSPFQIKKLIVFFETFFDHDLDGSIRKNDIEDLTERIRVYMGWEKDNPHYYRTVDLYNIFFSCLKEQVTREESLLTIDQVNCVTQRQWLNMWGNLIKGATSIMSFPSWVQILPKQIFSMIDKEENGFITEDELREFYHKFFGVTDNLEEAKYGYAALTANGDYKLTYDVFTMSFSNFLLGKTETGPGKYIFGVFGHKEFSESFKVDYDD